MKNLGDITKLDGTKIEPVNIIIGGSPCQNLSLAGNRDGLVGSESRLFLDQIRLVKEMRSEDIKNGRTGKDIRPRFMVWENVAGAFSCNKGADFQQVLSEIVSIVEDKAPVIPIPKNGWPTAGCITGMDGEWSIAWRVLDAQFWGVPQRRRRISLIGDFGGVSAPEILFERKSVSGDFEQSGEERKEITGTAERSTGTTGKAGCLNPWDIQSKHIQSRNGIAETLYAGEKRYGGGESYVLDRINDEKCEYGNE